MSLGLFQDFMDRYIKSSDVIMSARLNSMGRNFRFLFYQWERDHKILRPI